MMKIKFLSSLLLIPCSFSMEKPDSIEKDPSLISTLLHLRAEHLTEPTGLNAEVDYSHVQSQQRFLNLDGKSSIPILEQYRKQAVEMYQARILYLEDQKSFLQLLRQQASAQQDRNLQPLHPWFSEMDD